MSSSCSPCFIFSIAPFSARTSNNRDLESGRGGVYSAPAIGLGEAVASSFLLLLLLLRLATREKKRIGDRGEDADWRQGRRSGREEERGKVERLCQRVALETTAYTVRLMANSDTRGVRHVRCPRCHGLLQEPTGVPVYQCGGCNATLRAKNRSGDTQDVASSASPSRSGLLPPQSTHLGSGDVASTSTPTPDARSSEQQATGTTSRRHGSGDLLSARKHGSSDVASTSSSTPDVTTRTRLEATDTRSRRESGDLVSASKRVSEHVPATQKKEHDRSTNRGACDSSEFGRHRGDTDDAVSPCVSATFPRGTRNASTSELQVDSEERRKGQAELPEAARTKHSGEAAAVQPRFRDREEPASKSVQAAESKPSRDAAAATTGEKVPSPSRHELQAEEDLAPLRQKILKTVDELKGDLSELFSKSPDLNPTTRARPPPKQEGCASRGAAASTLPDRTRARNAAAVVNHYGSAARAMKPGYQVAAPPPRRGLPSRRYRRCRADPFCDNNVQPIRSCSCHHGCCRHHHGKPECSSCRGHCGRPTTRAHQEPSTPRKQPPAAKEAKRRPPPRHHCRPVLKGAPFIICSSCFELVQVPADFAASTNRLRKLRCGACSAVLSYSYRDPARKKKLQQDSIIDQFSTNDGSEVHGCSKGYAARPDPFAPFVDDFGLSSYSTTEDEQPLHVSRNTSFDTVDGVKKGVVGRLHRLMGYGSASELLRHSPDLYESFDERTTPDYDRKGKSVCIDAEDDDIDDSDDEDSGVLKRSVARGAVWPLPGMLGKGVPGPGAIRIKS